MKFETPEIKKVSFETENLANENIGGKPSITVNGSTELG